MSQVLLNSYRFERPFASLYEAFNPLTTINKQHFIEWFSGDALDTIWTKTDITGTGAFAMVDAVDEGFSIKSGANSSDRSGIEFNNKRQYSETGCVFIAIVRAVDSVSRSVTAGMAEVINLADAAMRVRIDPGNKYELVTRSSTTNSTDTSVDDDQVFHVHKLEAFSAKVELSMEGVIEATNTTSLPDVPLQPFMYTQTQTTAVKEGRIRYMECYNT